MKSKILFIVQLPPPVHGASLMNQYVTESKFLQKNYKTRTIPLQFVSKISQIGKIGLSKLFIMNKVFFQIINNMLFFKPDIVYLTLSPTGYAFYRDLMFVFIIKLFNKKLVCHLHGKGIKNNSNTLIKRWLYRFVFKNTKVIHLSPILYSDIANYVEKENCYFVPNGIPNKLSKVKLNENSSLTKNDIPAVLFLSNLVISKGVLVLLQAIKLIKESQPDLKFKMIFVGNPTKSLTKEAFILKIQELRLEEIVTYLGPKYGADKEDLLKKADIFVFPTFKDCFPLVLLEAMQAALPIISTLEGAIPEIVDNNKNGFLIFPKDVKNLSEKIVILLKSSDLRKKMGRLGKQKFVLEYDLDRFENRMKNVFDTILNTNI
jgi:glycosyltransferase involved in cell wall biosynthesis